jgi:hypothetical protein
MLTIVCLICYLLRFVSRAIWSHFVIVNLHFGLEVLHVFTGKPQSNARDALIELVPAEY